MIGGNTLVPSESLQIRYFNNYIACFPKDVSIPKFSSSRIYFLLQNIFKC